MQERQEFEGLEALQLNDEFGVDLNEREKLIAVMSQAIDDYYQLRNQFDIQYQSCIDYMKTQSEDLLTAPKLNPILKDIPIEGFFKASDEFEAVSYFLKVRGQYLEESLKILMEYLASINGCRGIHLPLHKIPKPHLKKYLGKSYFDNESIIERLYQQTDAASTLMGMNTINLRDHTSHLLTAILGLSKTESTFDFESITEIIEDKIEAIKTECSLHKKLEELIQQQKIQCAHLNWYYLKELELEFHEILIEVERYQHQLEQTLDNVRHYESSADRLDYLNSFWKTHTRMSVEVLMQIKRGRYHLDGTTIIQKLKHYDRSILASILSERHEDLIVFDIQIEMHHKRYKSLKHDCYTLTKAIAIERVLLLADTSMDKCLSSIPTLFNDNLERYKAMKVLERYLKDQLPELPAGAEQLDSALYAGVKEKTERLNEAYRSLKQGYLKLKREELLNECLTVDASNNMNRASELITEVKEFKAHEAVGQLNLHQLNFFETKFNCKLSLIKKERESLGAVLMHFFDSRKEIGGSFGLYIKQRADQYRVADFFRDIIAYPLTLFGYKSDRNARESYILELRVALNKCIQPDADLKTALSILSDKIEFGRMNFKPRALDGEAYNSSLHKFLTDFKSKIDPIIYENITLYELPTSVAF